MITGRQIWSVLTSRYLLATAAFICWILFFDRNDFFTRQKRTRELEELQAKIEFYQKGIADAKKELSALQNDPATLEQYAREQYFMKRPNEDIFVFDTSLQMVQPGPGVQ